MSRRRCEEINEPREDATRGGRERRYCSEALGLCVCTAQEDLDGDDGKKRRWQLAQELLHHVRRRNTCARRRSATKCARVELRAEVFAFLERGRDAEESLLVQSPHGRAPDRR